MEKEMVCVEIRLAEEKYEVRFTPLGVVGNIFPDVRFREIPQEEASKFTVGETYTIAAILPT